MNNLKWWASYRQRKVGPFETRKQAAEKLFADFQNIKTATTGYGNYGPDFSIEFIDRPKVQS